MSSSQADSPQSGSVVYVGSEYYDRHSGTDAIIPDTSESRIGTILEILPKSDPLKTL